MTIGGSRPVSPGSLNIYVHGAAGVLTLHGASLGGGSTLTINGDPGSTVENDGNINIQGGYVTGSVNIQTNLEGTGTLGGGADVAGAPAGVRLGGEVGAGQTINLTQTNLTLDQPMEFAGTLAGFRSDRTLGFSRGGVILANETATGTSFQQVSNNVGDLSVFTQDEGTGAAGATLTFHVAGNFTSDAFTFVNNTTAHSALIALA